MKKLGLLIIGGIAALVLLANLGPMVGLGIGLAILYYAFRSFVKAESASKKILWGVIGCMALAASVAHIPAVLGVAAIYVLFVVYKKWNAASSSQQPSENDPFTNFEKQWEELKQN